MIWEHMIAFEKLWQVKEMITHPKAMQQINFAGNLEDNATIFSIIEEANETFLDFSKETVKVL